MRVPSRRVIGFGLLGLAILLRAAYLAEYASGFPLYRAPLVDAKIYNDWAHAIAAGDWLSQAEGVFYRAPLYPYAVAVLLKLTRGPMPALAVVQQILGLATIGMSARLSARLGGPGAGLWTLALLILYGPLLPTETKILATSLGLFLHVAGLAVAARAADPAARAGHRMGAGALIAASALVRPQWLVELLVVPLLFLTAERRGWARRWLPFWAAAALVIAPVSLRNLAIGKDWVLVSSNGGMTLYQGNNPENHSGLLTIVKRFELFGSATQQRYLETRAAEKEVGRSLRPSETSRFFAREAARFVLSEPLAWLRLEGMKLYRFVTGFEYADNYSFYAERERFWPLKVACLPFGLLLAAGLLGVMARPRRTSPPDKRPPLPEDARTVRRLVLMSAVLGLGGCLVFYVSSRYRMEAVPALAILGGYGIKRLGLLGPRSVGRAPGIVALLVLAASFLPPGAPARSQESITWLQIGNAYENTKRPNEALAAYRRSVDLLPQNVFAWTNLVLLTLREDSLDAAYDLYSRMDRDVAGHPVALYLKGNLLGRMERIEEARAAYREAVEANPLFKEAHYNLALIEEKRGDYGAAADHLSEARRLGDESSETLAHLAYARLQQRRFQEARRLYRELVDLLPADQEAHFNRAVAEFYAGDTTLARKLLGEFVRMNPDDDLALYYLGLASLREGEPLAAEQALSRCLAANPDNARAAYYRGVAASGAGGPLVEGGWVARYGADPRPWSGALRSLWRNRSAAGWGAPLDGAAMRDLNAISTTSPELARDLEGWIADETAIGGP